MNVSRKGLFIVFEGLDGAGTTTQTRLLAARLAQRTPTVMTAATAEPSTGPAGSVIRQVLRHRVRGTDCFGKDKPFDPGALALCSRRIGWIITRAKSSRSWIPAGSRFPTGTSFHRLPTRHSMYLLNGLRRSTRSRLNQTCCSSWMSRRKSPGTGSA